MKTFLASRGGRWLLLASLALNLTLLVALGVARVVSPPGHHGGGPRGESSRFPAPWALRAGLSEERRADIEPILRQHREPVRDAVRATRNARREVNVALRAEPFDPVAFDHALARLRMHDAATAAAVHAMLVETVAELTVEERAVVAERMWRRRGGEHRQHREGGARSRDGERQDRH
jgi:uncharacterized membrane protein